MKIWHRLERLVHGKDPFPIGWKPVATVLSHIYLFGLGVDRWVQQQSTRMLNVPVICVGNCTLGGSGKTPIVESLVQALVRSKRVQPAVICRGYGQDEVHQLRAKLAVPVGHGVDRFQVARSLLKDNPRVDMVVMDDGMQHWKLFRDFNILVVNALTGCYGSYNQVVPLGALREPWEECLLRADAIIIHHANLLQDGQLQRLETDLLSKRDRGINVYHSFLEPVKLEPILPSSQLPGNLRKVVAFCGIGCPQAFSLSLERFLKDDISLEMHEFYDHYQYTEQDFRKLDMENEDEDTIFVTTEKDFHRAKNVMMSASPLSFTRRTYLLRYQTVIQEEQRLIDEITNKLVK